MTTVLRLDSSVFGPAGVSSQLNAFALDQLRVRFAQLKVIERDLHQAPLPHLSGSAVSAISKAPAERSGAELELAAPADEVIEQALAADIWLIGAPMYNFGMPSSLKAWFDYLTRAGTTFRYTDTGPQGLIADRPVIVSASRGGAYEGGTADFVVPHIKLLLNFVGLRQVHVIYAEGISMGRRDAAVASAKTQLTELIQTL